MRHILVLSWLLTATTIFAAPDSHHSTTVISSAIAKFSLDPDAAISINPLQGINFDSFTSRSYLYFYRAQLYVRMAQQGREKLRNLNHALDDLRNAQRSPNFDTQRVNQLATNVQKDLIEILVAAKNHGAVIRGINALPPKDKSDPRFVVLYAQALFHSGQLDDFKRLARTYHKLFRDQVKVATFLKEPPHWESVLETIVVPEPVSKPVTQKATAIVTKEQLLADPVAALAHLRKSTYFQDAEPIFKQASNLYFTLKENQSFTSGERKYVHTFRRHMYSFAPAFIDSLIFSHWKKIDLRTAELLSTSFLTQFEGHTLYPKVLFNLGRIQEDAKNYHQAAKNFKLFLEKSDDKTYLEIARFRLPWVLMLNQKDTQAKPYFEEYLSMYPEGKYASTSEYFLLKIKAKTTPAEEQQQAVRDFISKYPLNLYAYILVDEYKLSDDIIRKTLATSNPLKEQAHLLQEFKSDVKTLGHLAIYRELLAFGLKDDALKVLKNISPAANNELFALYLASQFQELEDTNGTVRNLLAAVARTNTFGSLIPWKSLYPDYRVDAITQELAAQSSSVSPLLVISLIRQESAFNPTAVSSAKAQGLMQLTPQTAKNAASKVQLQKFSLLNETDNLKLGIYVFDSLLKKYQNRLDYALAAYNAGETATNLWIALRGHLPPLEFIESIPYPETRVYIKSILRNHAIYRMLYAPQGSPLVSFNF